MRKAVYFFCTDYERDEVAPRVLNYLKENYDLKLADFKFANRDVYEYHDDRGNLFSFVETDKVLSYDYDLYIPLLNKYFKDYDIAGVVNWHGGKMLQTKSLLFTQLAMLSEKYLHHQIQYTLEIYYWL